MKPISLLLIPSIALFVSACAVPAGPGYSYDRGPDPRPGYYWNGSVYVEGEAPHHHHDGYDRDSRDVNNVYVERTNVDRNVERTNVDRTNVNDRTVNNTTINNTSVNNRTVDRTNVSETNVGKTDVKKTRGKGKAAHKDAQQGQVNPNGQ